MRNLAIVVFVSLTLVAGVSSAHAQVNTNGVSSGVNTGNELVNPLGTKDVKEFLLDILSIVTDIIGPVVVILMLVYVGFLFVTAQGKEAEIRAARQALQWTVVGALILLGAKVIALGIQATVDALKV